MAQRILKIEGNIWYEGGLRNLSKQLFPAPKFCPSWYLGREPSAPFPKNRSANGIYPCTRAFVRGNVHAYTYTRRIRVYGRVRTALPVPDSPRHGQRVPEEGGFKNFPVLGGHSPLPSKHFEITQIGGYNPFLPCLANGRKSSVPRSTEVKKNSGRRWHPSRLLLITEGWCGLGLPWRGGGGHVTPPPRALDKTFLPVPSAPIVMCCQP